MLKILGLKRKSDSVDQLLGDYDLPSFPSSIMTALSKLRDPEIPMDSITTDLEVDPGLHVRVLRTVNSVAFGLSHKVSNISHAMSLLGRSRLEALVLSVATKETMDRSLVPGWFDMASFWLSAARRAALARGIAQRLHPATQAEAFTAGLLQDMAVPVIAAIKKEEYRDIYKSWLENEDADLVELETDRFGICHSHLGASLAKRWDFPTDLVHNVSEHHSKADPDVVQAVHISSLIKDRPGELDVIKLAQMARQELGLSLEEMVDLVSTAEQDAVELFSLLN